MKNILLGISLAFLIIVGDVESLSASEPETDTTEIRQSGFIHLASAPVLEDAINNVFGTSYFTEKTKLHETLGEKEYLPLGVSTAVELAITDYLSSLFNVPVIVENVTAFLLEHTKHHIIDAILNAKDPLPATRPS